MQLHKYNAEQQNIYAYVRVREMIARGTKVTLI
jgi:hypothetical protein